MTLDGLEWRQGSMDEVKTYIRFASADPKLDFTFLYPNEWRVREIVEASYEEVFVTGPRNKENTFSLAMLVRATELSEAGGQHISLKQLVADYLAKSQPASRFRETSRTYGSLAGLDAIEIETAYTLPLPINTVNPKETSILERKIFFIKAGRFYEVMYGAVEEDYYQYLDTFRNMLQTFEFRDDTPRRVYRPLVAPAAVQAVREKP